MPSLRPSFRSNSGSCGGLLTDLPSVGFSPLLWPPPRFIFVKNKKSDFIPVVLTYFCWLSLVYRTNATLIRTVTQSPSQQDPNIFSRCTPWHASVSTPMNFPLSSHLTTPFLFLFLHGLYLWVKCLRFPLSLARKASLVFSRSKPPHIWLGQIHHPKSPGDILLKQAACNT